MANVTVAALLFLALAGAFTTAHGSPELRGFHTHDGMRVVNVSSSSPAEAAGLQPGMVITRIGNQSTIDIGGFRAAAGTITANETVTVQTQGNGTFTVWPDRRPEPEGNITYTPAPIDYVLPVLERSFPGTIQAYEDYNDFLVADDPVLRIGRWRWIQQRYDGLDQRAADRIQQLEAEREEDDRGVIGVRVVPQRDVKAGLEPFAGPLFTVFQVLFFIAMLNLMIGLANLLPVKGLDGGWMLDVLLQEWMPERADGIVRQVTLVTLGMIIISFLFLIGKHLL